MPLELLVELGRRMRRMTFEEFSALERLVLEGVEVEEHLDSVSQSLLDMIEISNGYNEQPTTLRLAR